MLTADERTEITAMLRRQRRALFESAAVAESDLAVIADDRESELEERAQAERIARLADRLDDRDKRGIEEIDAALRRLAEGRYGACARCRHPIPLERLRALPATLHCLTCADALASPAPAAESTSAAETMGGHAAALPSDLALLSDRELEETLREQIRADGRIDADELRVVCRHGTVHLGGTLPSEREHQELLKLLSDVNGLTDIDDHVAVNELLWTREDRTRVAEAAPEVLAEVSPRVAERYELAPAGTTEDVAESAEEDKEYAAPVNPTADEE